MPRPRKCRRICALPRYSGFAPLEGAQGQVEMTVEEYETIRLIDLLGCTQAQCAAQMGVARSTVQAGPGAGGGVRPAHYRGGLCGLPRGRYLRRAGVRPARVRPAALRLWLRRR